MGRQSQALPDYAFHIFLEVVFGLLISFFSFFLYLFFNTIEILKQKREGGDLAKSEMQHNTDTAARVKPQRGL